MATIATSTSGGPPAGPGRKRRNDLRLYWSGQVTSAFGTVFTATAMSVIAVVNLHATPGQISMISAASFLPLLLFGLPAGALADRITRPRRALITLDTISAAAVGIVALGVAGHVASVGWLVALGLVQGGVSILLETVYFIHLRQLTDAAGIGPARARLQSGEFAAGFVGRLLVGPTIVLFGAAAALTVDAASYVLSAIALLSMTPVAAVARPAAESRDKSDGLFRTMGVGLRFFLGDAFRRALLVSLLVPGVAMAGVSTLTGPYLLRVIKVPTGAYGLVFALSGLMGLAGSLVATRVVRPPRDPRRTLLAATTATIACGLLLPLAGGPVLIAAVCATLGLSLPIFFGSIANVAMSPVIVADVAEDAMGRTLALLQVMGATSALLGALLGGALGDWFGVRPAIWALYTCAVVAIAIFVPPAWAAARRLREEAALSEAAPSEAAMPEAAALVAGASHEEDPFPSGLLTDDLLSTELLSSGLFEVVAHGTESRAAEPSGSLAVPAPGERLPADHLPDE